MKKSEAVICEKPDGQGDGPIPKQIHKGWKINYPSSSHYSRNWDKMDDDVEEEKNEKEL